MKFTRNTGKKILERKIKVKRQTKIESVFQYSKTSLWFSFVRQVKKLTQVDLVGLMINIRIETSKMFVKLKKIDSIFFENKCINAFFGSLCFIIWRYLIQNVPYSMNQN